VQQYILRRLIQYFRCPLQFAQFAPRGPFSDSNGFFRFGADAVCYGKSNENVPAELLGRQLPDALPGAVAEDGVIYLSFDPSEALENLLLELYAKDWRKDWNTSLLAQAYYLVRPLLSVGLRRHLQRLHLAGWEKIPFPSWPVDFSVDNMYRELLATSLRFSPLRRIPFIWFWPNGASSCSLMTHDVETHAGRQFCRAVMDLDDSFRIKSSFQIVPEKRYSAGSDFLALIRDRGFEVVVHDLNHDGHLFRDREEFLSRAVKINAYGKQFGAEGFRAGVLYRKQVWFDALDFSYDMSVPNVAHLDPQRGGCCTVMPYFIGNILELPVTTTQDYTLFHILGDYSGSLWKQQIDLIMAKHGLISFIVHPDYVMEQREQEAYTALLASLDGLRKTRGLWVTTPAELNLWWRQRENMTLKEEGGHWRIEGDGKDRAQVAFFSLEDGRPHVEFQLREDQGP
jgi:hypothetical protein